MLVENDNNMPYIIEEVVMFDEVKGSLSNLETKDEISLPPTASCILLFLLSNDRAPVERRQFIEQVYAKFGFDLSNNTLNQYISLLRKNIRNLGVGSEVIITVPRVGFYVSSDVNVVKKSRGSSGVIELRNDSGKAVNKKLVVTAIIIVFLIVAEIISLLFSNYVVPEQYSLERAGKIGKCDLYLPVNLSRIQSTDQEKAAAKLADRYLPCTPGSVFIYDINAINYLNGTGKIYLSRCTGTPGEDSYAVCSELTFNEE